MRKILSTMVSMRSQKLEAYYPKNLKECKNRNLTTISQKYKCYEEHLLRPTELVEPPLDELLATDFPLDRCRSNQVVFGHGVKPSFAEFYHLSNESVKSIAMIRKPASWIRSYYKHIVGLGKFWGTMEEWVQSGDADREVQHLLSYFVSGSKRNSLEKRLEERMGADNVLTLFTENYTDSIDRLVRFLGASSDEKDAMVTASKQHENVRLTRNFSLSLSKSSLARLNEMLKPLHSAYRVAEKFANKTR